MQSPALDPLVAPGGSPRRPQRYSPTVADRPCLPIRCRFSRRRTTRPGVPSFLTPARLAVGFGPKELSPTLAGFAELAIHPADLLRAPCGSPAPGATRELGVLAMQLSPIGIRLGGQVVNTAETRVCTQPRRRALSEVRVTYRRRGRPGASWRPVRPRAIPRG